MINNKGSMAIGQIMILVIGIFAFTWMLGGVHSAAVPEFPIEEELAKIAPILPAATATTPTAAGGGASWLSWKGVKVASSVAWHVVGPILLQVGIAGAVAAAAYGIGALFGADPEVNSALAYSAGGGYLAGYYTYNSTCPRLINNQVSIRKQ